jgi:predicted nucleic acid-binding Zn ribbon protein
MAQYYKFNRENVRRKTGTSSLKEAIDELLALYKLQSKFDETSIVAHWEQIMGEPIAARTTQIYVKEKTLFVQFDSAPLRNELLLAKQKIISLINKSIGQETIDEVVFI